MLQLHHDAGTASMVPHIVLEELGLSYELIPVNREQKAHKTVQFLALNPNGLIPVLVDKDFVLYETAAICLYLADAYPSEALLPALGSKERARCYQWLIWLTNTMQATLLLYFYPERWADTPQAIAAVKQAAQSKISAMLDQLDDELARHRQAWFLGPRYSVLDAYVLTLCRWTRNMERPARSLANLGPYLHRVLERPSVQRVFKQQALAQPWV